MEKIHLFAFLEEVKKRVKKGILLNDMMASAEIAPASLDGNNKWGIAIRGPENLDGVFKELEGLYRETFFNTEKDKHEEFFEKCANEVLDAYDPQRKSYSIEKTTTMFLEKVKELLAERMKAEGKDVKIEIVDCIKNGMKRKELSVRASSSNIGMMWLDNEMLEMYYKGDENPASVIEICVQKIMKLYKDGDFPVDNDLIQKIYNYELMKENILPVLCPKNIWHDFLEVAPHRTFLDLAICYRIDFEKLGMSGATTFIREEMRNTWGVDEETLYRQAKLNMSQRVECRDIFDIIAKVPDISMKVKESGIRPPKEMMVISTPDQHRGASAILDETLLKQVAAKLGTNCLYIIPSSINECLTVKAEGVDAEEMKLTIRQINRTELSEEEFLSDNLYFYDTEKGYGICA